MQLFWNIIDNQEYKDQYRKKNSGGVLRDNKKASLNWQDYLNWCWLFLLASTWCMSERYGFHAQDLHRTVLNVVTSMFII